MDNLKNWTICFSWFTCCFSANAGELSVSGGANFLTWYRVMKITVTQVTTLVCKD